MSRQVIIHLNSRGSFDVQVGENIAHQLTFDEMLAEVVRQTISKPVQNRTYIQEPDRLLQWAERRAERKAQ